VLSTVWTPQRCSRSSTEKRRGRKEIEMKRQRNTQQIKEHDKSPPGSAIPGILQARTVEWVAISFSNA